MRWRADRSPLDGVILIGFQCVNVIATTHIVDREALLCQKLIENQILLAYLPVGLDVMYSVSASIDIFQRLLPTRQD